ncbi:hypothetical protein E2542_SST07879 [Spatholobus suberectus]|nr:hypothetical protein E2542_SST07879 [Spatholobus suberectus]
MTYNTMERLVPTKELERCDNVCNSVLRLMRRARGGGERRMHDEEKGARKGRKKGREKFSFPHMIIDLRLFEPWLLHVALDLNEKAQFIKQDELAPMVYLLGHPFGSSNKTCALEVPSYPERTKT